MPRLPAKLAAASLLFAALSVRSTAADAAGRAREVMEQIVRTDQSWVKIHAAEVLVACGEGAGMRAYFAPLAPRAADFPYRVGIWRVLAETAVTPQDRAVWTDKIEGEALDPAPDPKDPARRLRALEALGKLHCRLHGSALDVTRRFAAEASDAEASLPLWALVLANEPGALQRLAALLRSPDPVARQRSAYALRWLRPSDPAVLRELAEAADAEPRSSPAWPFLTSAALMLHADPARAPAWRKRLEHLPPGSTPDAVFEASQALMPYRSAADLRRAEDQLADPDANVRVGAAWTLLYATARHSRN